MTMLEGMAGVASLASLEAVLVEVEAEDEVADAGDGDVVAVVEAVKGIGHQAARESGVDQFRIGSDFAAAATNPQGR